MPDLSGRFALVTGSASGIGRQIAVELAHAGAHVFVSDIDERSGAAAAAELGAQGTFLRLDTSSEQDWQDALDTIAVSAGRLDILVNNAGAAAPVRRLDQEPVEDFDRISAINLRGVWLGIRSAVPLMREAKGASVVNIASIDSFIGVAGMSTYAATKFAVLGLTKSLALELGPLGIRVNAVHPGIIDTPPVKALPEHVLDQLLQAVANQPIARLGLPHDVAQAALFFASDMSAYCTGASLVVDGGHIAGRFRVLPDS
ncbi:MAG: glucose 1-dehydrogenase [Novosphingobium sp.]